MRSISTVDFDRVLAAHFASPVRATPADFAAALAYLDGPQADEKIVCADRALLDGLNELIDTNKLGAPAKFDFKAGAGEGGGGRASINRSKPKW